jgi:hypothetical protein
MTIIEPSMVMSDHHTLERRGNEQTTQQAHRWRNKKEKKATTTTNLIKNVAVRTHGPPSQRTQVLAQTNLINPYRTPLHSTLAAADGQIT